MLNRCSVSNSYSNYDEDYDPVFEMLNHWSKGMQDEWRRFLHRNDAWKLARVFICAIHFCDEDILLHFDIPQGDGTVKKVYRKPLILGNAKPINLPICPSYLSINWNSQLSYILKKQPNKSARKTRLWESMELVIWRSLEKMG